MELVRTALSDRYRMERELGRGGMASVYLAEDVRHRRTVALKVLRPELAAAIGAERFLREIEIAARLRHPYILPLYDSGEIDGVLFYVMPYVEGESLRSRLHRERQIPIDDVVQIASDVADALERAHSQEVIHRDIKPENILLDAGHAVVADFGIARAFDVAVQETLTDTGVVVGTPAYMSVEQASGDAHIDGRTDVYSLGCVIHEMLTGEPPYTGATARAISAKRLAEPVPDPRVVRETTPASLARLVVNTLAKVPADRPSAAKLLAALRHVARADQVGIDAPGRSGMVRSIAVLPFANTSADPENEYFSDGITEELINALTGFPSLRVAARTSSFVFKGQPVNVQEVGRTLNVDTVLEGSVRKAGQRLRVTTQLVDVTNGYHVWSDAYDIAVADVFDMQDHLAHAIIDALKIELAVSEEATIRRGTNDLEAYELYLKGRHYWYHRGLPKAVEYYERSIARDPDYAAAYAGLADCCVMLALWGLVPSTVGLARADKAARQAVRLDDRLAEARYSLALTESLLREDYAAAEREFKLAIEIRPGFGLARAGLALMHAQLRRHDAAVGEALRAAECEPHSSLVNMVSGFALFLAREYDKSVERCEAALQHDANFGPALGILALALGESGRVGEAVGALERAVVLTKRAPLGLMWLGGMEARAGNQEGARGVLRELDARTPRSFVPNLASAWVYLHLGETEEGFRLMEAAVAEGEVNLAFIRAWPGLGHLRRDPRWPAVLQSLHR